MRGQIKTWILGSLLSPFYLVPQNFAYVEESLGKYCKTAGPGLHFKVPFTNYVAYKYSLKEQVYNIDKQFAITKDNVMIRIDGVLYYKFTDAFKASYAISKPERALSFLAQTSMRSEIGFIDLDTTFKERARLNTNIKSALNHASEKWGIYCMRYEIKDITPPEEIKRAMELQAEHERLKRSTILQSEGAMQSQINVAEGEKQSSILKGDGEALKILQEARGITESLKTIGDALKDNKASYAMKLKLCESYVHALTQILDNTNTLMLPQGDKADILSTVAAGLSLFKHQMGYTSEPKAQHDDIFQKAYQSQFNVKPEPKTQQVKTSSQSQSKKQKGPLDSTEQEK